MITSHLWFDTQAREAAEFYARVFKDGAIMTTTTLNDTPSGTVDIVTLRLFDHEFMLISAGPLFTFTPAISFLVSCSTKEEVDALFGALVGGGTVLMELGSYPFSERYGWVNDKYGVSWQIMYLGEMPMTARITPTLMFTGAVVGKAEEAINFYTSLFPDSAIDHLMRYDEEAEFDREGTIMHGGFTLLGRSFAAMDSGYAHEFNFNEAISFIVHCDTQEEIDRYWSALSAVPEAEACGWLKDKYGVSWQVVPTVMDDMMTHGTKDAIARITQAFLPMKKFDIAVLERAYRGEKE
jgi:predicted 3-demethylubiquinone-9 3-methyltransferase (glyoxalase superfamily)